MKRLKIILCYLIVMINACKKEPIKTTYEYNVRMTDAPAPYDAVNIDLQGVEITGTDGKTVQLNVQKGIYNLLDYSNGLYTLIATGIVEIANVQQIRLILGANNSVVVNKVSYPLSTPSAEQSGLKLQVQQTLDADMVNTVLLDFDANKSIVVEGNGSYKLKPQIRTIDAKTTGAIKGNISPHGIKAFATATSSSNLSYSTNVNTNGDFMLQGLPSGVYSLTIVPASPLKPVTQSEITVTTGFTTNIYIVIQ